MDIDGVGHGVVLGLGRLTARAYLGAAERAACLAITAVSALTLLAARLARGIAQRLPRRLPSGAAARAGARPAITAPPTAATTAVTTATATNGRTAAAEQASTARCATTSRPGASTGPAPARMRGVRGPARSGRTQHQTGRSRVVANEPIAGPRMVSMSASSPVPGARRGPVRAGQDRAGMP